MPEGEAPHPRPGNPCGVCMEVNDEDCNPLRGHDLGCGSTEQLYWFCSPCIANLWSCPLCPRPHRLCTAPPPRETQDGDLTLKTLRTLIRQNVWNDGAREDSPDFEWLDVLTDENPATFPPPPLARTYLGAARPGRGPQDLRPRPRTLRRRATGQSTPHWQSARQLEILHPGKTSTTTAPSSSPSPPASQLPLLAGGGRGTGDGHRPRRPWRRVGGFLSRRRGLDPGGDQEADGSLPHVEGHPPSTQPPVAGTACRAAARPAAATGHVRQSGSSQDNGQRYPARRLILLPRDNHRDHHHPPAPIPRHEGNQGHECTGPNVGRNVLHVPQPVHLRPRPHPSPHHTNSTPLTPRGLRAIRHHLGPARHRAPNNSVCPKWRRNDNQHNTTRPQGTGDTGHHLPGAETHPARRIRGRWAPSPRNPPAPHTRTGNRPRAPQEARNP